MWFLELIGILIAIVVVVWAMDHLKEIGCTVAGIIILIALYWLISDHIDGIIEFIKELPGYFFMLFKYGFIVLVILGILSIFESSVLERKTPSK